MAEIIVSILVDDVETTRRAAARAAMAGADWIELRLDRWPAEDGFEALIAAVALPVLISCRTPDDGGEYRGTLDQRRLLFERALDAGARAIDLEIWEPWAPRGGQMVVRSHHDFRGMTPNLRSIRDRLLDAGDIAKVVCMAYDLADTAPLLDLMGSSDPLREPTVAFAMGERVAASRILSCVLGAPYIYASAAEGAATAPGQLPIEVVAGLYRAQQLGTQTRVGGVIGDPASNSLGPWIHNRALRSAGIDGVYLPLETSRPREVLDALPGRRFFGVSVTAPHKELVSRLCHRLTPEAAGVGAVNTVTMDAHGVLVGHNTDIAGVRGAFARAGLIEVGPGERAVVLGGGGAARAGAVALAEMGFEVMIMARSLDRIRDFASAHGFVLAAMRADLLADTAPRAVVHATPVGSASGPKGRILPDWTPAAGCYVLDMVYRPHWTVLLKAVDRAGAIPVPGAEMFLCQAAEQVASFFGQRPEPEVLRDYLAGAGLGD